MKPRGWPCALLILAAVVLCAPAGVAASAQFRQDCEALASTPNRLTGTPEYAKAADYVLERLRQIGPDRIIEQPFPATQLRVKRCDLTLVGRDRPVRLWPLRPNGIIPPCTPPEGITGRLVHVGAGSVDDLATLSVRDAIAVLDYNCDDGWVRVFRLGAAAVIFVRQGEAEARNTHVVAANVNLPRYYYAGSADDLPEGAEATIRSEIVWEGAAGRNVFAFFTGTNPVFSQEKDETGILAAHLDTYGEVPQLTPGARAAANCAGLLELAAHFKQHRPRRHVLLAFFDGQAHGHAGSSVFYRALETETEDAKVEKRRTSLEEEEGFLRQMQDLLDSASPLAVESDVRRQLLSRLSDKAAEQAYAVGDVMYKMREDLDRLEGKRSGGTAPSATAKAQAERLQAELEQRWQPEKNAWNELRRALGRERRALGRGNVPGQTAKVHVILRQILAEVGKDVERRREELALERAGLTADAAIQELIGKHWIVLHASLILGDTTPTWGLIVGGDSALHSPQDSPGLYGKVQTVFLRGYQSMRSRGVAPTDFLLASADQSLTQTRVLWGAPFLVHSGEVAGLFGIYNLVLGTTQECLAREGTPDDTLDRLNLDRIESQVASIAGLLATVSSLETAAPDKDAVKAATDEMSSTPDSDVLGDAVASQESLSLRRGIVAAKEYVIPKFEGDQVRGPMVVGMLPGSSIPNTPMPGAMVQFRLRPVNALAYSRWKPYAFDDFQVLRTNSNGTYALGPVRGTWAWGQYGGFAAVFDEQGSVVQASDQDSLNKIKMRLNVFRCRPGHVMLPPQFRSEKLTGEDVQVFSARANSLLDPKRGYAETMDGVVSWFCEERERGVKLFSLRQIVGLVNGPEMFDPAVVCTAEEAQGRGFPLTESWNAVNAAQRSASDLWRLNQARLQLLRNKGIMDGSLIELHGRSEDLLLAARQEASPLRREALAASSFFSSQPVYRKTRAMLDDLVFAVLILLGLCVPFAFALERVVVGAVTIYRQISWFVAFFALTFVALYFSHPAFAIANTPIIIFLGFTIVVMSSMVIFIIMRKFEVELKALQGMTTTVHAADVSRVNTFMAAMHMGISTMRRRPLRTALTAITILLLTFTILCFASFGMKAGIVTLPSAPNPAYTGVFLHDVNWSPVTPELLDVIRGRWRDRITLCRRFWISPQTQDNPGMLATHADGTNPITIRGLLGLDPAELRCRPDLAEILPADLDGKVLITQAVARALKVEPGAAILVGGTRLTVGPLLDAVRIADAKDMDGSSILPADFTEASSQQQTQGQQGQDENSLLAQRNWASLPSDAVAIVSADTAFSMGARLYGLLLYTRDTAEATDIAGDLARMLPMPVAATRANGVYRHVLGTVLAASGVRDLFFPILLGGLVIFGTMLGSVADREKEIYTFSALGLAPRHVATLFFAESMVYSLLGGMGGYLLAQVVLKTLFFLAGYGVVRVPEMNMSSTNTMVTILIVMATVLISAIYPAIKASKSANPGLMRVWRPPAPKGDVLDLVFPFTVSEYDITGVVSFLKEHFDNHRDTGLGRFMSSDVRLVREKNGELGLDAGLALAPFDLGVSQSFALRSTPSEIPGIDEVRVVLERRSGQPKDWQRLNKVFLDDLRQQFLIWRSVPHETMEMYRERTLTGLGGGAATPA